MTIKEIKELLKSEVSEAQINKLEADPRAGVQKLLVSYRKRQAKLLAKKEEFLRRFSYEKKFWEKGQLVAGVDEVGRGPLAGPVVTAAVIIDQDFDLLDVNDSKKLSPEKRLKLYPKLLTNASVLYYSIDNEYDCRKDESFLKCFGLLNLWREQCVQDSKSLSLLQKKSLF